MKPGNRFSRMLKALLLVALLSTLVSPVIVAQEKITSPEDYFGFQMGTDKKIARWDKIVKYFQQLEKESRKLKVINMGPSTMGHPFLLVIISSADNLANLDELQKINARISDPRGLARSELKKLISKKLKILYR